MRHTFSNDTEVMEACPRSFKYWPTGGSRQVLVVSIETPFEILCAELSNLNTLIEQSNRDSLIEQSYQDTLLQ